MSKKLLIFPTKSDSEVKLSAQIPSGIGVQSPSVFSADYTTFRCIKRYGVLPNGGSHTILGEQVTRVRHEY